jgi:cephalosporin hydroxylase
MSDANPVEQYKKECQTRIAEQAEDKKFIELSHQWILEAFHHKYMYNYAWMGRPIIQLPFDILAMQEIIWNVQPDLIIETGIAHGGSLIAYAGMMEMRGKGHVLGIDIDIRAHNRKEIETHPMSRRITMFEGSSVSNEMAERVRKFAADYKTILVVLDSNHTHEHVTEELEIYAPLASKGSYCVVFDTIVEDMPAGSFPDRPWDKGNNPKTAVREYLKTHPEFEIDKDIQNKLLITVAPDGYLRRIAG